MQEENLRAALLLEQAALCLLRVQPPSVRKFAFHMVLAGLRYNACDQKGLGTRAYRCRSRSSAPLAAKCVIDCQLMPAEDAVALLVAIKQCRCSRSRQ